MLFLLSLMYVNPGSRPLLNRRALLCDSSLNEAILQVVLAGEEEKGERRARRGKRWRGESIMAAELNSNGIKRSRGPHQKGAAFLFTSYFHSALFHRRDEGAQRADVEVIYSSFFPYPPPTC